MDHDLHILQHSLGLDQYGKGRQYRNHFVSGGRDVDRCDRLLSLGLMTKQEGRELTGGMPCYFVTQAGIDYVAANSPNPPRVSRGRVRYLHWLEVSDAYGCDFGEWLKRGWYKERP